MSATAASLPERPEGPVIPSEHSVHVDVHGGAHQKSGVVAMTFGITRRREVPESSNARLLDPKPGAHERIGVLIELEALRDVGIISEAEFNRQRGQILAELV